jgi:hypothetical protein
MPDTTQPLLRVTLIFVAAAALAMCGCGAPARALVPSPSSPVPTWCVQGVHVDASVELFCATNRARCETAAYWGRVLQRRLGYAATSGCFDRRIRVHEQRGEIR